MHRDAPSQPGPMHLSYRGVVTAWDCDHMGHLNIAGYVRRFDEAHWTFFAALGLAPGWMREQRRGMVAVEQRIHYLRELKAGEVVAIYSQVRQVKAKVLLSRHELRNEETGEVCAVEEIACAHLDTDSRRAVAFGEPLAAGMAAAGFGPFPAPEAEGK